MKQFLVTVVCAGAGFWLGAHRLVPLWLIVVLAVLGAGLWGVAEWIERRDANGESKP
ncbi:hypothetical protein C4K19_0930 [Pseudomonas chlororaphis subsp. aurantiaca]|nr:hypothetical protein C4K19_0930 [Pseudomonas chlororaphis subsp. aurantiaca]